MSKRSWKEEEKEMSSEAGTDSTSEEEELPEDYSSDDDSDDDDESDGTDEESDEDDEDSLDNNEDGGDEDDDTGIELSDENEKKNDQIEKKIPAQSDEYEVDSSDEEDIRNTVGNIPLEWYKDYDHLGYDVQGQKITKPAQGDTIDEFLTKMENPDYWRTVTNKWTGQKTVLDAEDVKLIKNLQRGRNPSASQDMYPEWIEFFSGEEMMHPVTNRPMDKRSFIPSKWEKLKVGQMVHSIKMGWMKPRVEKKPDEEEEQVCYDLWADTAEDSILRRYRQHIPAPKTPLPLHSESINPPPEYLFTKEEEEKWKEQEPEERRINYVPQKYSSLRLVPAYRKFINERFERCLDLYLCSRQRKMKMNVDPKDLLPKLPKAKDLQPFPTTQALIYKGHTDIIRSICPDPSGQWLMSGSDDGTVRFWEVSTGRCMKTVQVGGRVNSVSWNPNTSVCLVAVSVNTKVLLINPGLGDKLVVSNTDNVLLASDDQPSTSSDKEQPVDWVKSDLNVEDYKNGVRFVVEHPMEVSQVTWHGKGDYFATVMPKGDKMAVLIHLLSKKHSQSPFSKSKGLVQCVKFHPVRPVLFVATQRFVHIYNLVKQQRIKKLQNNCKWVSSMDVHAGGDNVIVGSYDCRSNWFDLDLSTKPYQILKHHKRAVRQVSYHRRYPLFASASDDGTVIVCHGKVFSDLLQNPLIVPVKVLRGHAITNKLGVMDCQFHPTQPWIFSAGADGTIRLFS
ncbi:ribosome biogenesis protein bop1-like [Babylonia areolata]|uniref:ribosome biogenesis protein bop1-like n=1 Tax=Babylonia areolata TaxID=304850 RepID=UPI003FD2105D